MLKIIDLLAKNQDISDDELLKLIKNNDKNVSEYLFKKADEKRKEIYSNDIFIRGLIEISNICKNDCFYCGIRKSNTNCKRYRLSFDEIMSCVKQGYNFGFRTFVLQGGEDSYFNVNKLCKIIENIKDLYSDCVVTLSLGEKTKEDYEKLFNAGAERYLLRHETINENHYKQLHPKEMSYDNRLECLKNLKEIGFQTGCGFMVGSPFQTNENIVEDLRFIKTFKPEMVGIGPFIPQNDTPFGKEKQGTLDLTLKLLAIIRLLLPDVLLPSTTALATINENGRILGIKAGANVIMPNLSPDYAKENYKLYENKAIFGKEEAKNIEIIKHELKLSGYNVVISRGDNIKFKKGDKMYNPKSMIADDFINHQEILDTLDYAQKNKNNIELINQILNKARPYKDEKGVHCNGLSHREASVLLACDDKEILEKIYSLANEIKHTFYGNRIVMFAPLYLSNYCVNGCIYCPYHYKNRTIPRKKLTQEEVKAEVIALQDMGHKRLAIESGEDPVNNPIEYILDCIKTIYSIKHKNGAIRRVNVNIAATTVENYKKLKEAGIGTYILFQETYHKESYLKLHPTGPKHDYNYHTEAMDRAMQGGIDDVGLGVLFGLERYKYEFAGLLMHAEHLEAVHGVGPHTVSVPRVKKADDINPDDFDNGIDDDTFAKLIALTRIAIPYTGIIISTRESQAVREKVIELGVSQISGASRTSVGGYTEELRPTDTEQFDVSDQRTLDEVVCWLMEMGHIPSFCTACYREGRTGDRFMSLCKSGQIQNCCHPNALMTLKEFLEDYASEKTKKIGEELIKKEVEKIPNEKVKQITLNNLYELQKGARDFRF